MPEISHEKWKLFHEVLERLRVACGDTLMQLEEAGIEAPLLTKAITETGLVVIDLYSDFIEEDAHA